MHVLGRCTWPRQPWAPFSAISAGPAVPGDGLSDGQLLDSFLRERDERLRRPSVPARADGPRPVPRLPGPPPGRRRRLSGHLPRPGARADAIRRHDSLASWLYGVALRIARRAKLDAARRRLREERVAVAPTRPPDEPDWRDLLAVLDEEIAALPEKYRQALVLCHLEGHTNADAARQSHPPRFPVEAAGAGARAAAGRLLRRGVTLSVAALLTVLAGQAGAAVPPLLVRTATGTACSPLPVVPRCRHGRGPGRRVDAPPVRRPGAGLACRPGGPRVPDRRRDHRGDAPCGPADRRRSRRAPPARSPGEGVAARRRPAAPGSRGAGRHQATTAAAGGNAKSEAAVSAGLLWIAKQQADDGHWSLEVLGGQKNDVAGTAFGLLPLLGAGHTPTGAKAPFARNVRRGLDFLIARQGKNGDFGGGMYPHALASCALFEAYALTGEAKLKAPAQAVLDYIVKAQHEAGGWRYTPGQAGDLSVTAWQIAALHDARAAGFNVPKQTLERAARFVRSCATAGRYTYLPSAGTGTPTLTAAGLLCASHLGGNAGEDSFRDAVRELAKAGPGETPNAYYLHWAAELLRRHGGDDWDKWNSNVRDSLVGRQKADGSWPVEREPFATAGGRLMISSLAVLTLEVYYRDDLLLAANPPRPRTRADLESLWSDLSSDDPIQAARRLGPGRVAGPGAAAPPGSAGAPPPAGGRQEADRPSHRRPRRRRLRRPRKGQRRTEEARQGARGGAPPALKDTGSAESHRRLEALLSDLDGALHSRAPALAAGGRGAGARRHAGGPARPAAIGEGIGRVRPGAGGRGGAGAASRSRRAGSRRHRTARVPRMVRWTVW